MCGGGTQTTTTKTEIPPEVLARYNAVNARAETAATTPFQQYGGEFVAGLNPTQQAGIQSTNQYAQTAQPYFGAGAGLTLGGARSVGPLTQGQIGYYQNPYTNYVAGATEAALRQQQGQQLSQQQAEAIKGGAFGGDRAGIQRAYLQGQQGLATAQALAPIYQQGYQQAVQTAQGQQGVISQDLARQMQAGQQIAGLGTGAQAAALQGAQAQIQAGTLGQQTQQAQDTALYQQFLQERGYPYQQAQFLANIAEGTGALSGNTQTSTSPAPFFSDKRLKHDAERIGEMHDGTPIYRFKYNGSNQTQIGLMAQDVEKRHPEAVGRSQGYKTVDYEKATDEAAHKANGGGIMPNWMGGAVANPGHYAAGGLADADLSALLAQQRQSFGPFGQGGLYGGSQHANPYSGGMGGASAGYVPAGNLHVPKMLTASPMAAPKQTSTASELYSNLKSLDSIASDVTGKGLFQRGRDATGMGEQSPKKTDNVTPPAPKPEDANRPAEAHGGLVPHYASGGPIIPGSGENQDDPGSESGAQGDVLAKVVKEGAADAPKSLPQPGQSAPAPQQGPNPLGLAASGISAAKGLGSIGSGVSSLASGLGAGAEAAGAGAAAATGAAEAAGAAGAAGGIGSALGSIGTGVAQVLPFLAMLSDERMKHNKREVGKLYDGQPVYSYDFGDGRTQIGLMAQNVEHKHPEAVAETRGGLKMVDYHRATEHAAHKGHFAEGGLVPAEMREHHDGEDGNVVGESPKYLIDPQNLEDMPEHRQSMIKAIYGPESGGRYDIRQGGQETFDTSGPHPGPRPAKGGESSAAGAGQFIHDTWNRVTGGAPMTKGYQDAATWKLASDDYSRRTGRDLDADLKEKGVTPEIKAALAPTWLGLGKGSAPSGGIMPSMSSITKPVSDAAEGVTGFLGRNKDIILPVLQGLGAMASSPSRYLGSAILQGLGAGAKSYSDLQQQQAGTKLTEAQIPGAALISAQQAFFTDKAGFSRVFAPGHGYVSVKDWRKLGSPMPVASKEAQQLIEAMAQRAEMEGPPKQAAASATGAPSAPAAPSMENAGATKNAGYAHEINLDQSAIQAAQDENDYLSNLPKIQRDAIIAKNVEYRDNSEKSARASMALSQNLNELTYALTNQMKEGNITPGALADVQRKAINGINAVVGRLGLPEEYRITGGAESDIEKKVQAILSSQAAQGLDMRAVSSLGQLAQALPSSSMDPIAIRGISADLLVNKQKPIDENTYVKKYSRLGGDNILGERARENFTNQYTEEKYNKDRAIVASILDKTINGEPLINYIMGKGKNPELQKRFTPEVVDRTYGPGISRYFLSNTR